MRGKSTNRLGESKIMNNGMKAEIIEYRSYKDIDVKFEDGYIKRHIQYHQFEKGNIVNPYFPTLYGVGYLGETNANSNISGDMLKSYDVWSGMLYRCYNTKYLITHPTYKDCKVCDEWLCYSNFKEWYDKHYYEVEDEVMNLDKDILVKGNKIYSPDTCIFVPRRINSIFSGHSKIREKSLPKGVTRYTYKSKIQYISTIFINGRNKILGRFNTPEEAFLVYKEAKEKEIKRVADLYKDKIPQKLYEAMYDWKVEITD